MAFIGNTQQNQNYVPAVDYFSGNGSTTAFTLSRPVASVAAVQAVISNVPQNPGTAFTVSGSTITFTSAPPSGTNNIYVYYTSPNTQVVQPGQGTVGTTQLVNSGVTAGTYGSASLIPAITVDATGRVTSATTNAFSAGLPGMLGQAFTGNGTFTIPSGVTALKITVVGGGGAGSAYYPSCYYYGGSGGGGGGTAISFLTGLTPGGTLAVTIGAGGTITATNGNAGGTSSVASGTQTISTISASGGGGGYQAAVIPRGGGLGGVGSGGTINIAGGGGAAAQAGVTNAGSTGGSSTLGGGGYGPGFNGDGTAPTGGNYGGGGGGGIRGGAGTTAPGAGAGGIVIFEW